MRAVRPLLFWSHLALGVAAGAIILVMSATGALLALKPQIVALVDRDVRLADEPAEQNVDADRLIAAVRDTAPGARVTAITWSADRDVAAAVTIDGGGVVYVDPGSGRVRGAASRATQTFFRTVEDWHRWLAVSAADRQTGRAITGACNLAFLFIALSGPFLWLPRRWSWTNLRAVLWFRRAATPRARDFNWHNAIGIWCAPALVIMSASGAVMSYRWANDLLYRAAGSVPPPRAASLHSGALAMVEPLAAQARAQVPTWATITLRLPSRDGAPAVASIVDRRSWNAFARSQLTLDAATASVLRWEPYHAFSPGQKLRGWARFAHTGELGGVGTQIVAGVACAGAVVLVWTGTALAFRRAAAIGRSAAVDSRQEAR